MDEQQQISVAECEEMCAQLLDGVRGADTVALWQQAWLRLAKRVGHSPAVLPAGKLDESSTREDKISVYQAQMVELLKGRTPNPRACMDAFERINEEGG